MAELTYQASTKRPLLGSICCHGDMCGSHHLSSFVMTDGEQVTNRSSPPALPARLPIDPVPDQVRPLRRRQLARDGRNQVERFVEGPVRQRSRLAKRRRELREI